MHTVLKDTKPTLTFCRSQGNPVPSRQPSYTPRTRPTTRSPSTQDSYGIPQASLDHLRIILVLKVILSSSMEPIMNRGQGTTGGWEAGSHEGGKN